jgi:teichoic acid transport system permease protein
MMHTWLNVGLSLVVARWGALFPDVRQLLTYVVRFLMYMSAVMFSIERFDSIPGLRPYIEANPLYILLAMYRNVLLYETLPGPNEWATLTVWSLAASMVGMAYFWQAEVRYGRRR